MHCGRWGTTEGIRDGVCGVELPYCLGNAILDDTYAEYSISGADDNNAGGRKDMAGVFPVLERSGLHLWQRGLLHLSRDSTIFSVFGKPVPLACIFFFVMRTTTSRGEKFPRPRLDWAIY